MKMGAFGRNLRALRDREHITQNQLSEAIYITQATISSWESKGKQPRQQEVIDALCDYFSCTEQDLFGISDGYYAKSTGISYPEGKQPFKGAVPLAMLGEMPRATMPYVGLLHAGAWQDAEDWQGDTVEVPASVAERHPHAWIVKVDGDCMDKVYPDGCLVVVDPDIAPRDRAIVAVRLDGHEDMMREWNAYGDTLVLAPRSHNPEHKPIVVDRSSDCYVEPIGTVVWYQPEKEL